MSIGTTATEKNFATQRFEWQDPMAKRWSRCGGSSLFAEWPDGERTGGRRETHSLAAHIPSGRPIPRLGLRELSTRARQSSGPSESREPMVRSYGCARRTVITCRRARRSTRPPGGRGNVSVIRRLVAPGRASIPRDGSNSTQEHAEPEQLRLHVNLPYVVGGHSPRDSVRRV